MASTSLHLAKRSAARAQLARGRRLLAALRELKARKPPSFIVVRVRLGVKAPPRP
jgi:hypothetical protein